MLKNKKLGVFSPANSITDKKNIEIFHKGLEKLQKAGFEVVVGKNVYSTSKDEFCGSDEEKISDLYELVNEVDYIICSTGGVNSNTLLNKIDYSKLKNKVFIGNSNPTLLFNAFFEKNKVISYIGPNVKSLGKLNDSFSIECLIDKIMNNSKKIHIQNNLIVLKEGRASGIAIGGNIQSIKRIFGTEYYPKLKKYILYIEASYIETNKIEFESIIAQMKQLGILKKAVALILGFYGSDDDINFYAKMFEDFEGPIVVCNNLGHGVSNNLLPIGKKIKIMNGEIIEL